jgi:hypothetical protein
MRLRCNAEVSIRKIDNELFVYNRDKALIHTFNRTGAFLWEVIEAGLEFDAIVGRMTETFNVGTEEASADLKGFIYKLKELGLVSEAAA